MPVRTLLKQIREQRGLAVAELARRAGVTRQAIYAIEEGTFVPNTLIALQLAKVLQVSVEELFALADEPVEAAAVAAEFVSSEMANPGQMVRVCRVGSRSEAFPVTADGAFLPEVDAVVETTQKGGVSVQAEATEANPMRLVMAGCDPALSLLAAAARTQGVDLVLIPCSSRQALTWLKQGRVHAAGSHLLDRVSGDYNVPLVRKLMGDRAFRVVTFADWELGLVVQRGNPRSIRTIADLGRRGVRIVNREKGAGSRDLLDSELKRAGIDGVAGYDDIVPGHLRAAGAVARGQADCCIAPLSAARCFGLDFTPLLAQRFDLVFGPDSLDLPATKTVLDALSRLTLRKRLSGIAGYDSTHSGQVLT